MKILVLFILTLIFCSCTGTKKIMLDGSKSYDPDGTITAYKWTVIEGAGTFSCNFCKATIYSYKKDSRVSLTVTDNDGAKGTTNIFIR